MPKATCAHEQPVLAALRNGVLQAAESDHLHVCESCALAVDAERWMLAAAAELAPTALPAAGGLLLRAQLRARQEAAARALRPLETWRTAATLVGGGLVVAVLATRAPFLAALWSSAATPAQALFAVGAVALAAVPAWMMVRHDPV